MTSQRAQTRSLRNTQRRSRKHASKSERGGSRRCSKRCIDLSCTCRGGDGRKWLMESSPKVRQEPLEKPGGSDYCSRMFIGELSAQHSVNGELHRYTSRTMTSALALWMCRDPRTQTSMNSILFRFVRRTRKSSQRRAPKARRGVSRRYSRTRTVAL